MTKTHTIEAESVTLFLLAAAAGIVFALYFNHSPKVRTVFNLPVLSTIFATPTPTPPPLPTEQSFSGISPDGTKKVTMTVTPNKTTSNTYLFTVSAVDRTNPQTIYSINLPSTESMSIPFNAFSPDNTYLFLQHTMSSGNEALVFKANGDPIAENTPYFNAREIFTSHATGNNYQTTTGWASETLLIINTTLQDNSKGPSYWLEVPSEAVIPLATEF